MEMSFEFFPKELRKKMPRLYETEGIPIDEKIVWVRFICPWNEWEFYGVEYDPREKLFFGYIRGDFDKWGYFSLEELKEMEGPFGLKIERDLYFEPITFNQLMSDRRYAR